MTWKKFSPCQPCCGMPLVVISTCDSSVNYTHLCYFENASGYPGRSCNDAQPDDPDGSCVKAPLQIDKDKWNEDREAWDTTRKKHESSWPVAGGIISGGFRCWAGVKEAITAITEPWAEDTYGELEFRTSGTSDINRINLDDLKELFETLYEKHDFKGSDGEPTNDGKFGFLFLIDNTGSIHERNWPVQVKEDFLDWVEEEYPNCTTKIVSLNNYLVDGEDWLRHFDEYYQETVEEGL